MFSFQIRGNLVDIANRQIFPVQMVVTQGKISKLVAVDEPAEHYLLPGFVDAHVHVESSMLTPSEFARLAVVHGTVASVSDPHEIANVLGLAGVRFMVQNARSVPFKFAFGAPSCVPATRFETAGAGLNAAQIRELFEVDGLKYLAEMMNWPGVLYHDEEVYEKIAVARQLSRPVDGHAPGLRGEQARQYIAAGISTDHECTTQAEAEEKLELGMKIIVREGSAAKNFAALIGLLPQYWPQMMFGSDDKHPDDLVEGHLNQLVARAVALGYDVFKVLQMACVNPVQHYGLPVGQLRVGDPADFIVVDNLRAFNVLQTYIDGQLVAERGQTRLPSVPVAPVNQFAARTLIPADLQVRATALRLRAIEALDGELLTRELILPARIEQGLAVADVARDLLKIVVVNRYADRPPAVAFIRNFGLRAGAIASSVAHDSHNVIAVGATDEALCQAIHLVMAAQGGVSVCGPAGSQVLPLPVAGLMAAQDGYQVAQAYSAIDRQAKALGSSLRSPYMTLSFMALLVIPALKLSDLGLFDGQKFEFVDLFVD